jgi:hypothetical protein
MPTNNLVGPVNYADGVSASQGRAGRLGDMIVSELNPRYYEQVARGNTYMAASQAVATTTVGLATTYTGLCLSNPLASGKNVAVILASIAQSVIQATQVEGYLLATGFNATTNVTHTTPGTVQAALVGAAANNSVAKVDTAATLPTAPLYSVALTNTGSATTNSPGVTIDLGGAIVLAPGAYACFVTPAQASVAGLWFGFLWAEIPI